MNRDSSYADINSIVFILELSFLSSTLKSISYLHLFFMKFEKVI